MMRYTLTFHLKDLEGWRTRVARQGPLFSDPLRRLYRTGMAHYEYEAFTCREVMVRDMHDSAISLFESAKKEVNGSPELTAEFKVYPNHTGLQSLMGVVALYNEIIAPAVIEEENVLTLNAENFSPALVYFATYFMRYRSSFVNKKEGEDWKDWLIREGGYGGAGSESLGRNVMLSSLFPIYFEKTTGIKFPWGDSMSGANGISNHFFGLTSSDLVMRESFIDMCLLLKYNLKTISISWGGMHNLQDYYDKFILKKGDVIEW